MTVSEYMLLVGKVAMFLCWINFLTYNRNKETFLTAVVITLAYIINYSD